MPDPAGGAAPIPPPAPRTGVSGTDSPDTSSSDAEWEALYQSVRGVVGDAKEVVAEPATHTTPVEPCVPYLPEPFGRVRGVAIAVAAGTPVRAIAAGLVVAAGWSDPYEVVIRHEDGMFSVYGHLSRLSVRRGQTVHTGQLVGSVGSSGETSGPWLRFEVCSSWREDGTRNGIDPVAYLGHCGVAVDGISCQGQKLPDESIFAAAVREFSSGPPSRHGIAAAELVLMVSDYPYIAPRVMYILTSYLRPPPQGYRQRSSEFHTAAQWLLHGVLATADPGVMVDLSGADLWHLSFTGGWFLSNINFEDACLAGARLTGCNVRRSHFFNAELTGADLRGTDLSSATGLTTTALSDAKMDSTTRLPAQFKANYENRHRSEVRKVCDTSTLSVGKKLTQVRLYRRRSLDQISGSTGITVNNLRLIEAGEYSPAKIPALGELLTLYAEALGMNPEPLIAELNHQAAGSNRNRTPNSRDR